MRSSKPGLSAIDVHRKESIHEGTTLNSLVENAVEAQLHSLHVPVRTGLRSSMSEWCTGWSVPSTLRA